MSEVKDVRAVLEECAALYVPEDSVRKANPGMTQIYMLAQALVSEGLAACDELSAIRNRGDVAGPDERDCLDRVKVFASILRKAGGARHRSPAPDVSRREAL